MTAKSDWEAALRAQAAEPWPPTLDEKERLDLICDFGWCRRCGGPLATRCTTAMRPDGREEFSTGLWCVDCGGEVR